MRNLIILIIGSTQFQIYMYLHHESVPEHKKFDYFKGKVIIGSSEIMKYTTR